MSRVKLITNSDDFGLNSSITDAIIDSHINGIMTSTTIMSNMEGTTYAIQKAKEISTLGVGIHFNLTEGKPISELHKIPLLLNSNGEFLSNINQRRNLYFGNEKQKQVELELSNQLILLLDNGIFPTHFDSHHHITGTPVAFLASLKVARKFKVNKARVTNVDYFFSDDYDEGQLKKLYYKYRTYPKSIIHKLNKSILRANNIKTPNTKILSTRVLPIQNNFISQFIRTLSVLPVGVTEISFHPGYLNSYIKDTRYYSELRQKDLAISLSPEILSYINKKGIQLINFKDL
jgi:predicted glycoside hydrolase/deacetylase ChbG (UPF0249 family)